MSRSDLEAVLCCSCCCCCCCCCCCRCIPRVRSGRIRFALGAPGIPNMLRRGRITKQRERFSELNALESDPAGIRERERERERESVPFVRSLLPFVIPERGFSARRSLSSFWRISGLGGRREYRGWVVPWTLALRRQRPSSPHQSRRVCVMSERAGPGGHFPARLFLRGSVDQQREEERGGRRLERLEKFRPLARTRLITVRRAAR